MTYASTLYGAAVALIKNKQIYLSRRPESVVFPKKWAFINGRLKNTEHSLETAVRLIEEQTMLKIDSSRICPGGYITIDESNEFYYVYIVNLTEDEVPLNTGERWRGDWRIFSLEKAAVLDVVPGIRPIIKGLYRTLLRIEASKNVIQPPIGPRLPTNEHIRQQLSQSEQLHLAKLGPKMTRYSQYPDGDSFGA